MKVIIAGSRVFHESERRYVTHVERLIQKFEDEYGTITEIVSGCARGIDTVGEIWARENGIPVSKFPANWKRDGKSAGPIRNTQMGQYADGGIIIWDGESKGSKHMSEVLRKLQKPFILDITEPTVYYNHQPSGKIQIGFHNPKDTR